MHHLKKYLMSRLDDCPALFVTERKPIRRLSRRAIQREIKLISERAGITKRVHPHTMRHTFATLTLNNGADLATVQALLGHSNPATTQVYAQVSDEHKREQYRKHLVQ
jgi:integrase/recombinase XerD